MTTQRHMMTDYHSVSQGRASVPPPLGGPWYPDVGPQYPAGRPYDSSRSLLLDIPSSSPAGGGGLGPRPGDRPVSASTQHLLTVATPTPPPPPATNDAINPELRQAQKSGDLYNISVNLNALQLAARPSSAAGSTTSMRRAQSLQNLAATWGYRPPSTTPVDDQEAGTTIVHVRRDNGEPSPPTTSTLPSTSRQTKPVSRTPSVRTLRIPASPGRRSRSASRASGGPDEGYVIKSLKSTDENLTSGRTSSTRLASTVDSKVIFDVELTQQQREQTSSTQHVTSTSGKRSLVIESVKPSGTIGRQPQDPRDPSSEPSYTMMMNQQMTMNYEPPLPPVQPAQPDIFDERVSQRTSHVTYSGRTRSDLMTTENGYLADVQPPPEPVRKKKKKQRTVNSLIQKDLDKSSRKKLTSKDRFDDEPIERSKNRTNKTPHKTPEPHTGHQDVDRPNQGKPTPNDNSDDEPVEWSKKPTTRSAPRKTPDPPRMVNNATQMPVNRSTQSKPTPKDSSDNEPAEWSKKPTTRSALKTPEPVMVNNATQMAVNKSTQSKPTPKDSSEDEPAEWSKKPTTRSALKTPEPVMVNNATQMAVNKSTQSKPTPKDSSEDEPAEWSKKPTTRSPPRKTPEPVMVNNATQMAVNKSTQSKLAPKDSSEDEPAEWSKKRTTRALRTPEPVMISRATQMAVNKSTQVKKPQDEDDDAAYTSSDQEPPREPKPRRRQSPEVAHRKKTTKSGVPINTNDSPGTINDRSAVPAVHAQNSNVAPEAARRGQTPVNGYGYDSPPPVSDEEVQPYRRKKVEALPNWQDFYDDDSDFEGPGKVPRQHQPIPASRRSPDDTDGYSGRQPDYQPQYPADLVDSGLTDRREPSLAPSDDDDPADELITPASARKVQAPLVTRRRSSNIRDLDDNPDNPRRFQPDSTYPNDYGAGTRGPYGVADRPDKFDVRPENWYSGPDRRSEPRNAGGDDRFGRDAPENWYPKTELYTGSGGDGKRPSRDGPETWHSRTDRRSELSSRAPGDRVTVVNQERFTSIPVTSAAFDEQDEEYLQKLRLDTRQSFQQRADQARTRSQLAKLQSKREEAKGLSLFYHHRHHHHPHVLGIHFVNKTC